MGKLYAVIALGLILLMSGCVQTGEGQTTKYVCADGTTVVTDINACPAVAGAEPPEPGEVEMKICSGMPSISGHSLEDACIIGVAAKYDNASLCQEVSRDERVSCYALIAETKNNANICAEAMADADKCYEQYARDKEDSSACGKITEPNNRNSCYSSLAGTLSDVTLCDKITESGYKDSCYSNLASQLGDASLCDKITYTGQKDSCYFNAAMQSRSTADCEKISNADQKQNCLQNISSSSGGHISQPAIPK